MSLIHHSFWQPKRGNQAKNYKDAFEADARAGRFAVADGATGSLFSGLWAQLLVQQFVKTHDASPGPCAAWFVPAQEAWLATFRNRELPYSAEEHMRLGSFATFLGLVIAVQGENGYRWHAFAVGDSCLFHTRGASLLEAFPVDRSDCFGTLPPLIGSRMSPDKVEKERSVTRDGDGCLHDRLWLMTDALSQWFLRRHEAGGTPWLELGCLLEPTATNAQFGLWVEDLRENKQLHDDDVTLMVINLE